MTREEAISKLNELIECTVDRGMIDDICYEVIEFLEAQEPIEARLHLCESCAKKYPECDATTDGMEFGCGVGNDNIIGCTAYVNRWKAQEPRVLALDEIHCGMAVWLEDVDKADVILAIGGSSAGGAKCFITENDTSIAPLSAEYGIRWRAWTAEPTDAQREAVKWDG